MVISDLGQAVTRLKQLNDRMEGFANASRIDVYNLYIVYYSKFEIRN